MEFKAKLKHVMQHLTARYQTVENISIDNNNLLEDLAFLNWLSKQKFYYRKERSWTHLFDAACYTWQPREGVHTEKPECQHPIRKISS